MIAYRSLTPAHNLNDDLQVLIVDDSPETARALASLLKRADYLPAVCHRGMEAVEYARQPLHAAVVDVHLPDLNGLVVTRKSARSSAPASRSSSSAATRRCPR